LQSENKNLTKAITAVSIAVLLIPLLWSALAFKRSSAIFELMYEPSIFRKLTPGDSSADDGSGTASQLRRPEFKLSFYKLSYFIKSKQILRDGEGMRGAERRSEKACLQDIDIDIDSRVSEERSDSRCWPFLRCSNVAVASSSQSRSHSAPEL
jgi:hypothetical protein